MSLFCSPIVDIDEHTIEDCADRCVGNLSESLTRSEACALGYESLIECGASLECPASEEWGRDPTISSHCAEEFTALEGACPGFWDEVYGRE